jgi:hypothetical protein
MGKRFIMLTALACACLTSSVASAVDYTLGGKVTAVKPGKLTKYMTAPGPSHLPTFGSSEDPTQHGAHLRFFDTAGDGGDLIYTLPASGWTALGFPAGSRGYKYRGSRATPPDSACQSVIIGSNAIKAVCKGSSVTLTPPFNGAEAVILGVPASTLLGVPTGTTAALRYCAAFGGQTKRNSPAGLKRKNSAPPPACGVPPATPTPTHPAGPTATATVASSPTVTLTPSITLTPSLTPTATLAPPTPTPTPTLDVAFHECPLKTGMQCSGGLNDGQACSGAASCPGGSCDAGFSHLEINAAAFPVPLKFSTNGTLRFGLGSPGAGGLALATCEIEQIDPINIPSIGYVCVQPAPGCDVGLSDCDAGTALGVDLRANGNVGSCPSPTTGNADCAMQCTTYCAGIGHNYLTSGCTGRCSASERVCTQDSDCANANEGSCNGPDPVQSSQKDICQCQCLDLRAGAVGGAGELQCQLGADIKVENGPPCGDGDTKIVVGRTCIPVTSATATTQITNANFNGGSVPSSPISNTGSRLACSTIDSSVTSGLGMRGVADFFGSSIGDLAVALFSDCQ